MVKYIIIVTYFSCYRKGLRGPLSLNNIQTIYLLSLVFLWLNIFSTISYISRSCFVEMNRDRNDVLLFAFTFQWTFRIFNINF